MGKQKNKEVKNMGHTYFIWTTHKKAIVKH